MEGDRLEFFAFAFDLDLAPVLAFCLDLLAAFDLFFYFECDFC